MNSDPAQIVSKFLTAVQQGDFASLGKFLHPEVSWNQPGNHPMSGLKQSSTELFQMVGQMFEHTSNTLKLSEINALSSNGNQVTCLLHWQADNSGGKTLDVENIDLYEVSNNLIVAVTVFSADIEQENHFWSTN